MSAQRTGLASIAAGLSLGLGGCAVGPDYAAPKAAAPEGWSSPLEGGTSAGSPQNLARWWSAFNDPVLDSLITRAIDGNLDLRIARARVLEARAQRGVVAADGLPQVNAGAGYSRSRQSEEAFGARVPGTAGAANQSSSGSDLYQAGFDALWELDLFGQTRRGVEAADAEIAAAGESQRDALVTLIAEVARNYVELRSSQQRLGIARSNVRIQTDSVELATARSAAGIAADLDVARAQAQLSATSSLIPTLEAGEMRAAHRLAVLLGREPGALKAELAGAGAVPAAPADIPIGLPSDLLRRRPDIRRAERQVAAATARIGVATADLFPKVSLTGAIGVQSSQLGTLPSGDARYWSVGPSVSWSIFSAGRIRDNIRVQEARQAQSLAVYELAILGAFEDAENALTGFGRELVRRQDLTRAVSSSRDAVNLSTELYQRGLSDFLSVIDSERQLFQNEDALALSERNVAVGLVSLYKALGGGWEAPEEAVATRP